MSYQVKNQIPETLDDCFRKSPAAEKIENFLYILDYLGGIFLIVVIVVGVVDIWQTWQFLDTASDSQGIVLVFPVVIAWVTYAVIEFFMWKVFSLILEAISAIVQNSVITANLSAYSAKKRITTFNNFREETSAENGVEAPTEEERMIIRFEERPKKEFKCPNCGAWQRPDRDCCWQCKSAFVFASDNEAGNERGN